VHKQYRRNGKTLLQGGYRLRILIEPHIFNGTVTIPASKSHTIRRLLLASFTQGVSRIERPLDSLDTLSCAAACRVLGAEIIEQKDGSSRLKDWIVRGRRPGNGVFPGTTESSGGKNLRIDVGNSGTTLFLALAAAALDSVPVTFSGDSQIARRNAGPLLDALSELGVSVISNRGPDGKQGYTPITVCGPWKGGRISISCPTSQYLSALLIAAPLAQAEIITEIDVPLLNEKPYVEMTLSYLKSQGLYSGTDSALLSDTQSSGDGPSQNNGPSLCERIPQNSGTAVAATADFSHFHIRGGGAYAPMNGPVPGDFSSAAFPAAAAVISKGTVTLLGIDPEDTQGDKAFFDYLEQMGCDVLWERMMNRSGMPAMPTGSTSDDSGGCEEWRVTVSRTGPLKGGVFDLNATPDMLPVMAALGAFAKGTTALVNAAHARIKETDRIAVMASELRKLFPGNSGFRCEEKPDGLLIHGCGDCPDETNREMPAATLDGHDDHRIVMALACAALGGTAPVMISSAEAADVTYPGFLDLLNNKYTEKMS
jgi:3-phosphoshikimate 1-carboxyvinyltransferase